MERRHLLILLVCLMAACADVAVDGTTTSSSTAPLPAIALPTTSSSTLPATTRPQITSTTGGPTTYLVWASGGLEPDLSAALVDRFGTVSIVKGGLVELQADDGSVIPLDGLAVDRQAHRPFDDHGFLPKLQPGSVVLGAASAAIRTVFLGDVMTLDGADFTVSAVVADEAVSYAEVVFDQSDEMSGLEPHRFALIRSELSPDALEAAVLEIEDETPLRILAEGDTSWLRHADGVLPQVLIKQALGEFSYTGLSGAMFDQDDTFRDDRIVTTDVPLLGETVCHEVVTEMLVGAMSQLVDEELEGLVDPSHYGGCWSPRFIRSASGTPAGLSRHAWGAAVDINVGSNPYGSNGDQDPRLVEIMESWGFTWGGRWLVPDPMHFEYAVRSNGG